MPLSNQLFCFKSFQCQHLNCRKSQAKGPKHYRKCINVNVFLLRRKRKNMMEFFFFYYSTLADKVNKQNIYQHINTFYTFTFLIICVVRFLYHFLFVPFLFLFPRWLNEHKTSSSTRTRLYHTITSLRKNQHVQHFIKSAYQWLKWQCYSCALPWI